MQPILLPVHYHFENRPTVQHEVCDRSGGLVATCGEEAAALEIIKALNATPNRPPPG